MQKLVLLKFCKWFVQAELLYQDVQDGKRAQTKLP